MTVQETVQFASQFFAAIWGFMKGVEVPFMSGVSVAGLMVGIFVANLGLKLVLRLLGQDADIERTSGKINRINKAEKRK